MTTNDNNERRKLPEVDTRPPERNPIRDRECLTCGHKWTGDTPQPKDGSFWTEARIRCPVCDNQTVATVLGPTIDDLTPVQHGERKLITPTTPEEIAATAEAMKLFARARDKVHDPSELKRRAMLESGQPYSDLLDAKEKWNTEQLRELFVVHAFLAPFVTVTRKSDGVKGTLEFTHDPRWYFNFVADDK